MHAGILLRNGYWFNLETETWEQRRFPPYAMFFTEPNAITSFRGKPTVFGNTVCDDAGSCTYSEVVQYDPETDSWDSLGQMSVGRAFHTVIEVPVELCYLSATTTTTTTTITTLPDEETTTSITTTTANSTTTPVPPGGGGGDGVASVAASAALVAAASLLARLVPVA